MRHRYKNKQLQYLVQWKDLDEITWEPEYHFDTQEVIDEYWQSINKKRPNSSTIALVLFLNAFKLVKNSPLMLLAILGFLCLASGQSITDDFKLCDIKNRQVWSLPNSCKQEIIEMPRLNNNYHVLSKTMNEFDGLGTSDVR